MCKTAPDFKASACIKYTPKVHELINAIFSFDKLNLSNNLSHGACLNHKNIQIPIITFGANKF